MHSVSTAPVHKSATTAPSTVMGRIIRGMSAMSCQAVVNILTQMSVVPVALYFWGESRYGEWLVLSGMISVLTFTDMGLQTFVVNLICADYSRNDLSRFHHHLHSALRLQIPLLGIVLFATGICLCCFSFDRWLDLKFVHGQGFVLVVLVLAFELLFRVPAGVLTGVYRATGRLARAALIGTAQTSLLLIGTLSIIAIQGSFLELALARVFIGITFVFWVIYDLKSHYSWLAIWPSNGTFRDGAKMLGHGFFFVVFTLANYVGMQGMLLVVQSVLDSSEVSRLATHRTAANLAVMGSGILTAVVWPELTRLHALGDRSSVIRAHRTLVKFNTWLVAGLLFGLLPFLSLIFPAWTAGRFHIDYVVFGLLAARTLLWGIWNASLTLLASTNRHASAALIVFASAVLSASFAIFLVPRMGIGGAALAVFLGDLIAPFWLITWLACKESEDNVKEFWVETGRAFVFGVIVPLGLGLWAWYLLEIPLWRYGVVLPSSALLAGGLIWMELCETERNIARRIVQRFILFRKLVGDRIVAVESGRQ